MCVCVCVFHNNYNNNNCIIEEASNFWKELWEKKGIGNNYASWLEEVKTAINQRVPASFLEDTFILEREKAVKVIRKK